jgi:hypothetical protein
VVRWTHSRPAGTLTDRGGATLRRIETRIGIAATPSHVWSILADFESWSTWNSVLHIVSAQHVAGSAVRFRPVFDGAPKSGFRARMVSYEEGREFAWFGAPLLLPALGCGVHWFRITSQADGTLFEHGEEFGGLLTPLMPKAFYDTLTSAYEAFNLALKTRAEGVQGTSAL